MAQRLRRIWAQLASRLQHSLPPRQLRVLLTSLLLSLLLFTTLAEPIASNLRLFSWAQPAHAAAAADKPNHPDPTFGSKTVPPKDIKPAVPPPPNTPVPPAQKLTPAALGPTARVAAAVAPSLLSLSATADSTFTSADGRLTVQAPAGVVSAGDVSAAPGKQLHVQISQIAPGGGSIAGGSGLISFGTYLLQVVDSSGVLVKHGLRKPLTLKLRPTTKKESALDLHSAFVVVNSTLPEGTAVAPISFSPPAPQHGPIVDNPRGEAVYPNLADRVALGMGALSSVNPTLDTATNTLITPLTLGNPSMSVTWNTNASVATFGAPDPFTVSLSSGALIGSLPISLPPAPGGTLPPVQLHYNSAEVSERHNVAAPSPWVGEGWGMGLGAISWTQLNLQGYCSPGCGDLWQSQWFMNDAFGSGSELIPNDWSMSTFYDDTPYFYCVVSGGNCTYPGWPKTAWRTADGVYNKVVSIVGPNALGGQQAVPPCFRAWRTDGTMLEFGCTIDSLVYYVPSNTGFRITSWLLDLITDPEGNQIHLTYQQDIAQGYANTPYPRATELATIEYDDPNCHDAQTRCVDPNWKPLVKVVFNASHAPARLTNTPSGCNTGLNLRCDDPLDLSGSGGLKTAAVESTFVLNDIQVQTRNGATNPWNTLRTYQLSYAQSGPATITDPSTGKQQSTAGQLLLTKYKELGDDGTTALPERNFAYQSVTQYFTDSAYHPNPTTNCGPAWNTGTGSGCLLWSQSYAGNSSYLVGADNGIGLHSIFSWDNARSNTHGVNGGGYDNTRNPLYCNTLTAAQQATYPCNAADDHSWSRAVTSIRRQQHYRAASTGNVLIDSQYTYVYFLATSLPGQLCTDCTTGMYWGNKNDSDYPDYYNGHFMGFAEVSEYFPDGSKIGHRYYATEGWGVYDTGQVGCTAPCATVSWWHLGNAAHGMEYEASYYDTDNATLLKQDKTQYSVACPPPNVAATPPYTNPAWGNWNGNRVSGLDHNNPVAVCSVLPSQQDHFRYDGGAVWKVPQSTTTYAYEGNNYRRLTDVTTSNGAGLKAEYYGDESLTTLKVTRLDPNIDFDWGNGSPDPSIGPDSYSARWTGKVTPQTSETYTFYTTSDDGVRLWVNGVQIINNWTIHGSTENSGTIALTAGVPYDIKLEYFEHQGGALIHLSWSSPSVAKQVLPQSALSLSSNATGSPDQIVSHTDYIWNDNITATLNSATGRYLIDYPAYSYTRDLANTIHYACHQTSYDTAGYATGQQTSLSKGEATTSDAFTGCGTSPSFTPTGQLRATTVYDVYGQVVAGKDPDANAGVSGHTGCTVSSVQYTACLNRDSVYKTLPVSSANALNQSASTAYTNTAGGGFGFWPTSATDPNGQLTSVTYDALGRNTSSTLPGEGTGLTTTGTTYTVWCSATGAQAPCVEVDGTQRLDSGNTVTQRSFYDGLGRLVETRTPAPNGQDVVRYTFYDSSDHPYFASNAYFVTAYTGAPGAAAFAAPDVNQVGSSSTYDALDRVKQLTDPLSHVTTMSYAAVCNAVSGDFVCYEETKSIDANSHQDTGYVDGWGRATYAKSYTGNGGGTYAVYATTKSKYDGNGNLVQVTHPNGTSLTRWTYDAAGRQTAMSDPDRGSETYAYDQNGNVTQTTDARGAGGGAVTLLGDTTIEPTQDFEEAGTLVAFKYSATTSGRADTVSFYLDGANAATQVLVGLYSTDGSGNPNTLLGQATLTSPAAGAWNSVSLSSVTLTAGQTYFIALLSPLGNGRLYYRDTVGGAGDDAPTSQATNLGALPTPFGPVNHWPQRGSAYVTQNATGGAIYAGYDGLNRQVWRNATNSSIGAYVIYSYDDTTGGNQGIGRRTGETFSGSVGSGSYTYTYDGRGQVTNTRLTLGGTTYPLAATYNDAGQILTRTYPTGETVTTAYGSQGWLASLSRTLSGTTTTLANTLAYTGAGGASGALSSARIGNNTYNEAFSYDNGLRLTGVSLTRVSDSATLFASAPSYDAANNVVSVATTLPGGTDNQGFCYDEQDRLTWAATSGTKPCGGTVTAGTLTSAAYSQTFGYDNMNRLTSGPAGAYTYGDSAHLHAATAVGTGYTAKYDAAGDMTCRAPTSSLTCAGTITGHKLTYDNEGRLTAWQNAQTSPTATDSFLYDGEGHRVEQQSVVSGATTTTLYVGGVEEIKTSGATTTTTTYYQLGGQRIALGVNGTLSYLASDLLGSTSVALDGAGNVTASQLFAPYGTSRYSNGTMPTDRGFTGQRADAITGLDYYNARYYDPAIGQFASADLVLDGLNRYAYVGGNPETDTDPTGYVVPWRESGGGTFSAEIFAQWAQNYSNGVNWDAQNNTTKPAKSASSASGFDEYSRNALDRDHQFVRSLLGPSRKGHEVFTRTNGGNPGRRKPPGGGGPNRRPPTHHAPTRHTSTRQSQSNQSAHGSICSFSADTPVATPQGEQAIGSLKVGDTVIAYDPTIKHTSTQTVEHVWINHDDDLLDVTLARDISGQGAQAKASSARHTGPHSRQGDRGSPDDADAPATDTELVHTTDNHPWLTLDRGWLNAGELRLGEQVVRLDGATATVVGLHSRTGEVADYYNLTVSELHTYAVGAGQFVVHNCGGSQDLFRGDGRSPGDVFQNGFQANGTNMDLDNHLRGDLSTSGYVGTSKSRDVAGIYAAGNNGYVYQIKMPFGQGADINELMKQGLYQYNAGFAWEQEVAIPVGIASSNIVGAWLVVGGDGVLEELRYGPFIPNPHFGG